MMRNNIMLWSPRPLATRKVYIACVCIMANTKKDKLNSILILLDATRNTHKAADTDDGKIVRNP